MPERPTTSRADLPATPYSLGSRTAEQQRLEARSAADRARSLLPHLRPGMRLLDVGCGPGTITIGLAEAVGPGEVVGIDIQPAQVERATALAVERGVANARFDVGDAYRLPFADGLFDAVYANTLLSHLHEPTRALVEMHRVLRPGGVVCVADIDTDSMVAAPPIPDVVEGLRLFRQTRAIRRGRDVDITRIRGQLLAAGFDDVTGDAFLQVAGTLEQTRLMAQRFSTLISAPADIALAVAQGWASESDIERIVAAWHAWGERADALFYQVTVAGVGWKGGIQKSRTDPIP